MNDPPKLNSDDSPSHPLASVDDVVTDLARWQARLSWYIVHCPDDLDPKDSAPLARLYGQRARRLRWLLSAKHTLATTPPGVVEILDEFNRQEALAALSAEPEPDRPAPLPHPTAADDLRESERNDR
jgi:hypothetical protein